jgi:uroporphyrinogen decarboxylase
MAMTRRERLEATLAGGELDRPAVSIWKHFYDLERTPEGLVEAMIGYQRQFDWDFMKVNPRACYHVQDWGNKYDFSPAPAAGPNLVEHRVKGPDDWAELRVLNPSEGVLGDHIHALGQIRTQLDPDVPMIMTVFTPLSLADELAGKDRDAADLFAEPDKLKVGLERITETFEHFIDLAFAAGVDGIFFATTLWGTTDKLTTAQYDEFSRPYDERLVKRIKAKGWFNVLHVCKSNNMLLHLRDLEPDAFHWDATDPTNLTIGDGLKQLDALVIGGIDGNRMDAEGAGPWVDEALKTCADATNKRRWIVGAGCTVPSSISDDALTYVRKKVDAM